LFWLQPGLPPIGAFLAFYKTASTLPNLERRPVLVGGRVKPLDTVARNALLIIHGKQQLRLEGGGQLTAMEWLTDTMFNASVFGFRFSFAALILDLMFCVSQHADRNCYYIS
jgi:hypothetical protein